MEQIQSAIKTYIDSQSSVLKQATEMINKRPQDLKNNIGSIQTALKGIECLA
jgi:flagellar capping protein FliD